MTRTLVAALAVMLLFAPVAPFAAVGSAAAAPAGMATIPNANVAEDVPDGETIPLSASALEGGVLASEHADSLEVVLTTAEHAPTVMDSDSGVVSGDGMAVVLRDDTESAGREVALDAGQLQAALGYRPEAIRGTHEDGSTWTASVEYVDGYLVFDVPHFSSNTVTFSGEVTIDASGATNGTQFQYTVADGANVSDASLELTGEANTDNNVRSWRDISDGETLQVEVNGNSQASGSEITLSGDSQEGGSQIWTHTDTATVTDVAVDESTETVFFGSASNTLEAIDGADGSQTWTYEFPGEVNGVAVDESTGTVFAVGGGGEIHAIDGSDGSQIWTYENDAQTIHAVAVSESTGTVYVATSNIEVIAVDATDGSVNWIKSTTYTPLSVAVDESTNSVFAGTEAITAGGNVVAFDGSDGTELWKYEGHPDVDVNGVAVNESSGTVYSAGGKELHAIDTFDGSQMWTYTNNSANRASVEVYESRGIILLGNTYSNAGNDNEVLAIDISTRSQTWVYSNHSDTVNGLAVNEATGTVYSASSDNEVHAISTYTPPPSDPAIDVDDDGASEVLFSGELDGTHTETVDLPLGSASWVVSTSGGPVDVNATIAERTVTKDASVTVNSDAGTQTADYTNSLPDGSTVDLSNSIDESRIGGSTTVTVTVDDPASGPAGKVDLNYSHSAQDQISTTYQATTFEERYNISHTYSDATENAQATIPFASSRVVGVKSVEYRVDGGSWASVSPDNYRLDGTTLDVYLDDATGGVEAGQTVDVRATGRKISVENGAVTVTDPTAPGEDLDTQLQIDSRSQDFHVNVGPTDDGDRVHYAYADNFPTEDYVVIDAAGNQQLHLPNAVQGDRFRVRHLDTRVVAEQGDVRIDVIKAGQNPELDVSPGPGGSGDPVTVEYYNTESGVTYLLNSLTRSIVVDSDTAESPAIFEDDDSEDTWAILRDSGPSGSSGGGGGAVGQFRERASDTVGAISLPIDGSGLGQLALVGVLGLGGVVALQRLWPFGGDDSDAVTRDTTTGGSSSGRLSGLATQATGLVGSLGSVGGRAARTTGSGLLTALQRVLEYFGRVTAIILGNRRASIAAAVVAAIVAARVGLVQLPEGTGILIVVSGVPLATWLIMRRSDAVSRRVWLASTIAAVILGLEFVAPGTVQTAIEQLTSEQVAPLLILVGAGGLYLWYRARQSDRPQIIIGGNNE